MRTDYTSNGMHKDDPTNPQSHWNDWTIDRDGNKLEEVKPKNRNVRKEIENIDTDLRNLSLKMNIGLLTITSTEEKVSALSSICESLVKIAIKQRDLIEKLQ